MGTRPSAIVLVACVALSLLSTWPAVAGASGRPVALNVSLVPDGPAIYTVRGLLTETGPDRPIVVLLAGATESGIGFWDFPGPDLYNSDDRFFTELRKDYSFVRFLQKAGYPSLALDRIGTGKSDRPPAELVTIESNVFVIDQVVQALRGGSLIGQRYPYAIIIGAGHSLAGPIVDMEAGIMGGFDGAIIQSFAHNPEPPFSLFATTLQPAQAEPRLASAPPGYFTTRAPSSIDPVSPREQFFFQPPGSYDPAVVRVEESIKDTVCDGEVATFAPAFAFSQQVTVPVLSVLGRSDALFCAPEHCRAADQEAASYPRAASFTSRVIDGVGHDMNLQYAATTVVFPLLVEWLRSVYGPVPD